MDIIRKNSDIEHPIYEIMDSALSSGLGCEYQNCILSTYAAWKISYWSLILGTDKNCKTGQVCTVTSDQSVS